MAADPSARQAASIGRQRDRPKGALDCDQLGGHHERVDVFAAVAATGAGRIQPPGDLV
jgi:hypothetical protein